MNWMNGLSSAIPKVLIRENWVEGKHPNHLLLQILDLPVA